MNPQSGQCNICGSHGTFLVPERGREGMLCPNCSSSSRLRAVMHALSLALKQPALPVYQWASNKSLTILESSARGSYPVMLADKFDYYATEYDAEKIAAGTHPREFADFQNLHYKDNTFDIVIASDVFEHVRRDRKGYEEILRVLKPGGTFILTVPYDHDRPETIVRVDTSGENDVHLLEPEYHGGGGHTLTYRTYGRDLLAMLASVGYAVVHLHVEVPANGIPRQSIIICSKGAFVDIAAPGSAATNFESLGMLLPYRLYLLWKFNMKGFIQQARQMIRK